MPRFRSLLALLFSLVLAQPVLIASDLHVTADPARDVYKHSAWAHGYIHGYESGFHFGNRDFHMGRRLQDVSKIKESKDCNKQYDSGFGDRSNFKQGCASGFQVGYTDAMTGVPFRAAHEARQLAREMSGSGPQGSAAREFDAAFSSGYAQGRTLGLNDGRLRADFIPDKVLCPQLERGGNYCDAYGFGFRWGYSDGYNNQAKPEQHIRSAKK